MAYIEVDHELGRVDAREGEVRTMYERIVVGFDGSGEATRALPMAAELARMFQSEIVVVHVVERGAGLAVAYELETPEEAADLADRAVRQLKDLGVSARREIRHALHAAVAQDHRRRRDVGRRSHRDGFTWARRPEGAAHGKRDPQI